MNARPLSPELHDLLSQIQTQPDLSAALQQFHHIEPSAVELHELLRQGEALHSEIETLILELLQVPQLLSDEQLESVAAGRLDLPGMMVMLASSLTLFSSDGAALIGTSLGVAALSQAIPVQATQSASVASPPAGMEHWPWMAHALSIIKEFEGLELEAYVDAVGVVTIGWGTTLYADGRAVKLGDKVTAAEAEQLLRDSILRDYAPGVFAALPMARNYTPKQQAALISFTYNVGVEALKTSTLCKRLQAGESPDQVVGQELPRWRFGDQGQVLAGLERRRQAEVKLFRS